MHSEEMSNYEFDPSASKRETSAAFSITDGSDAQSPGLPRSAQDSRHQYLKFVHICLGMAVATVAIAIACISPPPSLAASKSTLDKSRKKSRVAEVTLKSSLAPGSTSAVADTSLATASRPQQEKQATGSIHLYDELKDNEEGKRRAHMRMVSTNLELPGVKARLQKAVAEANAPGLSKGERKLKRKKVRKVQAELTEKLKAIARYQMEKESREKRLEFLHSQVSSTLQDMATGGREQQQREAETKQKAAIAVATQLKRFQLVQKVNRALKNAMDKKSQKQIEETNSVAQSVKQQQQQQQGTDEVAAAQTEAMAWLKWAAAEREKLKRDLLADPAAARAYFTSKQAALLQVRDQVLSQVWFNTDKHRNRWEMDLNTAMAAANGSILAEARMAHHQKSMWVRLKGDGDQARFFHVDLSSAAPSYPSIADLETHDSPAHSLLMHLRALGVPTTVEVMPLPLRDWDPVNLMLFPLRAARWAWTTANHFPAVSRAVEWYGTLMLEVAEEVFLLHVQFMIPVDWKFRAGMMRANEYGDNENKELIAYLDDAMDRMTARHLARNWPAGITFWLRLLLAYLPLAAVVIWVVEYVLSQTGLRPVEDETDVQFKRRLSQQLWTELEDDDGFWSKNPVEAAFQNVKRMRDLDLSFDELAGADDMREDVDAIVTFLTEPERFSILGARPPRGVLVTGDSGTGKSSLVYAIAELAGVPLVEIKGMDLSQFEMVGIAATNVRDLFKSAREMAPMILFIDDIEFFASKRGSGISNIEGNTQERESMLNQLLVELDGFDANDGVVVIATTRNPDAVDPAVLRPGRMDVSIKIPLPNEIERERILRKVAAAELLPEYYAAIDWTLVAEQTNFVTPRDLVLIPGSLEKSATTGRIHDKDELLGFVNLVELYTFLVPDFIQNMSWFQQWELSLMQWLDLVPTPEDVAWTARYTDFSRLCKPGIELRQGSLKWDRATKYPHAVWAAGRALLAELLPNFDSVDAVWLSRDTPSQGIGFTRLSPYLSNDFLENRISLRSSNEKQLTLLFGSHCAALLLLPSQKMPLNTLANQQLNEAEKLVTRMVMQYGWSPNDSPIVYQPEQANRSLDMGYDYEKQLDEYAQLLYRNACEKAGEILTRNRRTLEALVETLCLVNIVPRELLEEILSKTGATREEEPFQLVPYTPPQDRRSTSPKVLVEKPPAPIALV